MVKMNKKYKDNFKNAKNGKPRIISIRTIYRDYNKVIAYGILFCKDYNFKKYKEEFYKEVV
jgi:hypothetical protein